MMMMTMMKEQLLAVLVTTTATLISITGAISSESAKQLVDNINQRAGSPWRARVNEHAFKQEPTPHEYVISSTVNDTYHFHVDQVHFDAGNFEPELRNHINLLKAFTGKLGREFDSSSKWKYCTKSFHRVSDQGQCRNGHAKAVMGMAADRRCIITKGNVRLIFSDTHTRDCCFACGKCNGAMDMSFLLDFWQRDGFRRITCVPSNITKKCGAPCEYHGSLTPPINFLQARPLYCYDKACPSGQNETVYRANYYYKIAQFNIDLSAYGLPKMLNRTMIPPLLKRLPGWTLSRLVKVELQRFGPFVLCFEVYEGFLHYVEGVYDFHKHPGEKFLFVHCVKVIGYGTYGQDGKEYLLAVNSWSKAWGIKGTFKVDLEVLKRQKNIQMAAGVPQCIPSQLACPVAEPQL